MPPPRQPNRAGSGNSRAGTPGAKRQILNVTARKGRVVQHRKSRALARIAVTFLAVVVLAGAVVGAWYVKDRFFLENPHYNLQDLEVKTDGTLPQDTIVKTAGLQPGVNLFKLDLAEAARRLEALPQVESVRLQRSFPSTVTITIIERKPVAWMVADGNSQPREQLVQSPDSFLVDQSGMLLHLRRQLPEYAFLPIVRGCDPKDLAPGRRVDAHEGAAALELVRAHRNSLIGARFALQEIDVSKRFGLVATDRNGLQVLFGLEDFEGQLKRLDLLLAELERTGQQPVSINLMVQKNTPVTLKTDGPIEAPSTQPAVPEKSPAGKAAPREPARSKSPASEPKSNDVPTRKAVPVRPT